MDFTQKIINQRNEPQTRTANVAGDRDGEDSDVNIPVPPPQNPNEEWYHVFINVYTFFKPGEEAIRFEVSGGFLTLFFAGWTMLMH